LAIVAMLAIFGMSFGMSFGGASAFAQSEMTWQMKTTRGDKIEIAFFSQDRKGFRWPAQGRVYTLTDDDEVRKFKIACLGGEKICYGAWVSGRPSTSWGMGQDGKRSCQNCCYTCNGNETRIIALGY